MREIEAEVAALPFIIGSQLPFSAENRGKGFAYTQEKAGKASENGEEQRQRFGLPQHL